MPHHLLDVLDPWESASVAWWLRRAAECCREIEGRGRRVLFVGGTPLVSESACCTACSTGRRPTRSLRRRLTEEAERLGAPALHARLAAVDAGQRRPAASQRRSPRHPRPGSLAADRPAAQRLADAMGRPASRRRPSRPLSQSAARGTVRPHRRPRPPYDRRRTGGGGPAPCAACRGR